jgi:hypothetical protein
MADPDQSTDVVGLEVVASTGAPVVGRTDGAHEGRAVESGDVGLEVPAQGDALASALKQGAATPADDRPRAQPGTWKKRANAAAQDTVVDKQLALLMTEASTLKVLWPELSTLQLLVEDKPTGESLERRWAELVGRIDAVARRGYEQRAQAGVAQTALDKRKAVLTQAYKHKHPDRADDPTVAALVDCALDELIAERDREFVQWVLTVTGAKRALYAQDLLRFEQEAEHRGLDRARAKELVRAEGIELHETAAREWSRCVALPDAPSDLDSVGRSLLAHPAHGFTCIKRGAITEWLKANDAPSSIVEVAEEIRRLSDRNASESHVVHTMAWLCGRSELVLRDVWIAAPAEISTLIRAATLTTDDLTRAARDRVLGAWLRRAGYSAAATAADALSRDEAFGLERLAWALGEPLRLGEFAFNDSITLARTVIDNPPMRSLLERSFASGELLAWMESLATSRSDARWLARLRRATEKSNTDAKQLWAGVYATLGTTAKLAVKNASGVSLDLTQISQLSLTHEVATFWDALKESYRSGELLAWLAAVDPEHDYIDQARPADDDSALNELLWELGHTGLVVEWGPNDQAATTPDDLVRLYRLDRQWFEGQLRRGYIFRWLERFYAKRLVGGVALEQLIDRLRGEMQGLPSGMLALKTALLCGLRQLPLDPCEPGDPATFFGYIGVSNTPSTPEAWEPLRLHMTWGAGHLWVAQLPSIKQSTLPLLMNSAFSTSPTAMRDAPDRLLKALALTLGSPIPSPALAARLGRITQTPEPPVVKSAPTVVPTSPNTAPQNVLTKNTPNQAGQHTAVGWLVLALVLLVGAGAALAYMVQLRGQLPWATPAPGGNNVQAISTSTPGCVITHPRVRLASHVAAGILPDRSIHGVAVMNEFDFAWTRPGPSGAGSIDDATVGWARMTADGSVQQGYLSAEMLRPRINREQIRSIVRPNAMEGRSTRGAHVSVDQWIHGGRRRDVVVCGDVLIAQQLPNARGAARVRALADPLAEVPAGPPDFGATFYCRSVGDVRPMIVGIRGTIDPRGTLTGAELYTSDDPTLTARRVLGPWSIDLRRVQRAANPMANLREQAPGYLESAVANNTRVVVAGTHERLFAWIDHEATQERPALLSLAVGSEPSAAFVALNSTAALVVWTERAGSRRKMTAANINLRGSFQRIVLDPFATTPADLRIAPVPTVAQAGQLDPEIVSVAALADGGWIVAWTQRASDREPKTAWLQRYNAEIIPVGSPLLLTPNVTVAASRLVYDPLLGFVLAYAADGANPTIYAVRGECR